MANLLLLAAVAAPVLLLLGIVLGWRLIADRDRRRSPLNFKLLNSPGDGLRQEIERHDEKMNEAGMITILVGPITLAGWPKNTGPSRICWRVPAVDRGITRAAGAQGGTLGVRERHVPAKPRGGDIRQRIHQEPGDAAPEMR